MTDIIGVSIVRRLSPNESVDELEGGTYLRCISANQDFDIEIDDKSRLPFGINRFIRKNSLFKKIKIINNNPTVLDVELIVSDGQFGDESVSIAGSVSTEEAIPNDFDSMPDVAIPSGVPTIVVGQGATKEVYIDNPSSVHSLRVGDSAIGASRGRVIPPLGSWDLKSEASLYIYQNSGSVMNVPVNYMKRV